METRQPDKIGEVGEEAVRPMKPLLVAVASCLALATGCNRNIPSTQPQGRTSRIYAPVGPWQRFTSKRGGYSVEFPGKPIEKEDSIRNANDFSATLTVRDAAGVRFFSSYSTTFLKGGVGKIGPKKFLEQLYQQVWAPKIEKRLVYKRFFEWRGWPAIEFRYGSPSSSAHPHPSQVVSRQFVVRDTVYTLTTILPQQRLVAGDSTQFFQSFRHEKDPIPPKYTP